MMSEGGEILPAFSLCALVSSASDSSRFLLNEFCPDIKENTSATSLLYGKLGFDGKHDIH